MDSVENGNYQQSPYMKYNRYQGSRDPSCCDPELYCKYRSACLIHFMGKNNGRPNGEK